MEIDPLWLKGLMLLILTVYIGFLIRNRGNFNVGNGVVISAVAISFALSMALALFEKNGMNMGYVGLIFSSLAFGWIGGISGAFGIAVAAYSMGAEIQDVALCLVVCATAGGIAGTLAKRSQEFSNLLLASVLAGITVLCGNYGYLVITGMPTPLTALAPKTVSVVTGVVIGTAIAFYVRNLERWPEPIERKK